MTSTARARPISTALPHTQNTAPVHEHRGLYTHDLRRKAKRWQDGYIRFHTFNSRVMLYDDARNLVGDTYHREAGSDGLQDGDELELDRAAVLVQVGERLITEETDLSGLFAKRAPKPLQDENETRPADHGQLVKPLNTLQTRPLNIASNNPGRWAGWDSKTQLRQISPNQQRQGPAVEVPEVDNVQERHSKRPRRDDEHIPLWEILKTTRPAKQRLSSLRAQTTPVCVRRQSTLITNASGRPSTSTSKRKRGGVDGQARFKVKEIIDITSSAADDASDSDARGGVINSSPAKELAASRLHPVINRNQGLQMPQAMLRTQSRTSDRNSGTGVAQSSIVGSRGESRPGDPTNTVRAADGQHKINVPTVPLNNSDQPVLSPRPRRRAHVRIEQQKEPQPQLSSPPVSTKNHISAHAPVSNDLEERAAIQQSDAVGAQLGISRSRSEPAIRPLQLAITAKRNTLLCQSLAPAKSAGPPPRRRNRSPIAVNTESRKESVAAKASKRRGAHLDQRPSLEKPYAEQVAGDLNLGSAFEDADLASKISKTAAMTKHAMKAHAEAPVQEAANFGLELVGKRDRTPTPHRPGSQSPLNAAVPDCPHVYPNTPPDYSRLDAQLLVRPAKQLDSIPTGPGPPKEATRTFSVNRAFRPLRRATSDTTSLSPRKAAHTDQNREHAQGQHVFRLNMVTDAAAVPAARDLPQNQSGPSVLAAFKNNSVLQNGRSGLSTVKVAAPRLLRRAETHNGVLPHDRRTRSGGVGRGCPAAAAPHAAQNQAAAAVPAVGAEEKSKQHKGPWTREAWDLTGWLPAVKTKQWETAVEMEQREGLGQDECQKRAIQDERSQCEAWIHEVLSVRGDTTSAVVAS